MISSEHRHTAQQQPRCTDFEAMALLGWPCCGVSALWVCCAGVLVRKRVRQLSAASSQTAVSSHELGWLHRTPYGESAALVLLTAVNQHSAGWPLLFLRSTDLQQLEPASISNSLSLRLPDPESLLCCRWTCQTVASVTHQRLWARTVVSGHRVRASQRSLQSR